MDHSFLTWNIYMFKNYMKLPFITQAAFSKTASPLSCFVHLSRAPLDVLLSVIASNSNFRDRMRPQ